jgi:hypothetical protein
MGLSFEESGAKTVTIDSCAAPPKFTPKQIGKLRRQFVTISHGTVNACQHKFHPTNEPRTNCDDCWEAYFRVQTGVVKGIQSILLALGDKELVKARGAKFYRRFKQFAAKIEEEQRNAAAQEIK